MGGKADITIERVYSKSEIEMDFVADMLIKLLIEEVLKSEGDQDDYNQAAGI